MLFIKALFSLIGHVFIILIMIPFILIGFLLGFARFGISAGMELWDIVMSRSKVRGAHSKKGLGL